MYCENTRHKIQTIGSNKQILRSNGRAWERKRIHSKSKSYFKDSIGNTLSEDQDYRTQDEKQEDIDVWDQEMQSKTHVYETIIETLEYHLEKLRQGSTVKQELDDELITKERDNKGVGSSSTIKVKQPKHVIATFNWTYIDSIRF